MKLPGATILLLLLMSAIAVRAQQNEIVQRIFLVSNGDSQQTAAASSWLKNHIDWNDKKNSIVFIGNSLSAGLPGEEEAGYPTARAIIDEQVSLVLGKNAKAFFIPGHEEKKKGMTGGLSNETRYLNNLQAANIQVLPADGCPGPVDVQVGDHVVLVGIDSQWWLEHTDKIENEPDCDFKNEDEIIMALRDIIASYPDKEVLLAMEDPLYTGYGPKGKPAYRRAYRNMVDKIEAVLKNHLNILPVAVHDHYLALLQRDSISATISDNSSAANNEKRKALFVANEAGFAVVEISSNRKVNLKFYRLEYLNLNQPAFDASLTDLPLIPLNNEITVSLPDSITAIASGKFKSSGFRDFLLGKNYREEWKTPVRVRVINLSQELGGLTPLKRGGGHQTKSLKLRNPSGKEYSLRLVEKSVTTAALPPDLREATVVRDLVSDGVSASYPYAALSIPPLAEAVNVPHAHPVLVYVGDDPRLGKFKTDFANSLCFLEEKITIPGIKKAYTTTEMADMLKADNDNSVDQKAMLQARLLDMFFMDFDRHELQWSWAAEDNGKGKIFRPMPKDRDQPFFISKGLLPSIARKPWISPQVQGFRAKAINIKTYNFNAKNIDRAFLNELDEKAWKKMTDKTVDKFTDELIESALRLQPLSIRALPHNQEIIQKLEERKKYYAAEMMEYYRFISKVVTITGSDKKELFDIARNEDGSVMVKVYKITKDGDRSHKIYERLFDPAVTKEIRLYGMGGDDRFAVHGKGNRIKIRMIGGPGNDEFESDGSSAKNKSLVYDLSTEQNHFTGDNHFRKKLSADPAVNNYERLFYKYDLNIPFVSATYNKDDGLYLGVSVKLVRQGFHKTPYKSMQQFTVNHSLETKAYNFRYNAEYTGVFGRHADLLVNGNIKAPNNTSNFFGYGNASIFDKSKPGKEDFYRARYNVAEIAALARQNFSKYVKASVGPFFQYYGMDSNDNHARFITQTNLNGLDPATLYKHKSWLGAQLLLHVDTRNNKSFPTSGITWQSAVTALDGLNSSSRKMTSVNTDLAWYIGFSKEAWFTLVLRAGAGHNFGHFEFYQAQYLSGTENVRGYRENRFAGRSIVYNNIEARIKLAEFRTYLFPGAMGLLLFHDMGRVWSDNDSSNNWHSGYGAGLWFSPLKRIVIAASYGISKEDKQPLVTFGWQF